MNLHIGIDWLILQINYFSLKRVKKILKWTLLTLLFLIIAIYVIISSPWGQNYIARKVTARFSKELQTKIKIDKIGISLFNKMNLQGVLIEDQKKDTLLYAGNIQVRITDWFFLKDKAVLKYVGLEDAFVHVNRTDSVWNYAFIIDYFSSPSSPDSKKGIELALKETDFKNITFKSTDKWRGEDLGFTVKALKLDADEINFNSKKAVINLLFLDQPKFTINDYPGLRPPSSTSGNNVITPDSLLKWNRAGWLASIDKLTINNGLFKTDRETAYPPVAYFDGRHIEFSAIDGEFEKMKWEKDTITATLNLKTKEQSGFEVKKMTAGIKFFPQAMEFTNMDIVTNKSKISGSYAMRYEIFDDMRNYITKVKMEASFKDTEIDSDDIAFFAPELSSWKKRIKVTGNARGTVDDINGDDMIINAGGNTYLNGDISMVGLPNIEETFIDFKANRFKTTYQDAVTFIPSIRKLKNPRIDRVQYVDFEGNFTGFIRDFVTFGTIHTNLGTITSDLNMKLPENKPPVYSGNISSSNFQLGRFIDNGSIGLISFDGKVQGSGFKQDHIVATIKGKIKKIEYQDYTYQNITADGNLNGKVFSGSASIDDPNFAADINGLINLDPKEPRFDLEARIEKANLKNLKLSNENYSITGNGTLDFTGKDIDDFTGKADLNQIIITKDNKSVVFEPLTISSEYIGDSKSLSFYSDQLDGNITGNFSIKDLPAAFTLYLNKYLPAYIKPPATIPQKEAFTFTINTRNTDNLLQLFDNRLTGFNNSVVTGELNLDENKLDLNATVPYFGYDKVSFINTALAGKGNLEKLSFDGSIDMITINDSITIPDTKFSTSSQKDVSDIIITTEKNNSTIGSGEIKTQLLTFSDGIELHFDSSSFVVNGKTWNIAKNGQLNLRRNTYDYGQLLLTESNQVIQIDTEPSSIGDWSDVKIKIDNINLGDIAPFVAKKNRIEGLVSGTITVEDPTSRFNVISDIRGKLLRLDDDSIGEVNANVIYNNKTGEIYGKGANTNPEEKIDLDFRFYTKDTSDVDRSYLKAKTNHYPISIVERFTGSLFTDLEGYATGDIEIAGLAGKNLTVTGKPFLTNGALTVAFTQCRYKIENTYLDMQKDAINLGTLTLIDRFGEKAVVSGNIQHNSFRDMNFNVRATTGNTPFELINTTLKDNTQFFGRAKGTGSFSLTGPQSDMQMKINAVASGRDSSYITIMSSSGRETGSADFLEERVYGREQEAANTLSAETNITYEVDLTANRWVNMKVVLDPLVQDEISGRGEGNIKIRAGTNEDLSLRGRYDITDGKYNFSFQSFFKKPFILKEEAGNYIEWNGDPYNANIKIDAVYVTEKDVTFPTSFGASVTNNNAERKRGKVYVIAKLRGELFRPDISFELDFPPESPAKNDITIDLVMRQIQSNKDELNKQVAYLILSNNFAPTDVSNTGISPVGDAFVNTISGVIANEIGKALSSFLSKIDPSLRVNFTGTLLQGRDILNTNINAGAFSYDRTNLNLTLGKSFFNDRVVFTFEGAFDVPITANAQYSAQLFPNFTTEILLNQNGTIRAVFFYKENYDVLTGTTGTGSKARKVGASLSYRKESNTLWNLLFGKNKKIQAEKIPEQKETPDNKDPAAN